MRTKEVARRGYREVLPKRVPAPRRPRQPRPPEPLPESEESSDTESEENSDSKSEEYSDSNSEGSFDSESELTSEPPATEILDPDEAIVPQRGVQLFPSPDQPPKRRRLSDGEKSPSTTNREHLPSSDQPRKRTVAAQEENCSLTNCPNTLDKTMNPDEAIVPQSGVQLFPLPDQPPKRGRSTDGEKSPVMTNIEHLPSSDQPLKRKIIAQKEKCSLTDCPNTQGKGMNTLEIHCADTNVGITLDDLIQQSAEKLENIGEELGVTRPTLKCICQELSMHWWPLLKRFKVDDIQSIPSLTRTSVEPVGGVTVKLSENRPCSAKNATEKVASAANPILTDRGFTMLVKATYRGDIIKFPFCSDSGIEKLHGELDKRFALKVGRFKIKYEEDGEWILMCCDEDLHFHMNSLNASGLSMMNLSVSLTN